MKLGKIIEKTVENKIKTLHVTDDAGTSQKLKLNEYYKAFDNSHVGRHTTYDIIGEREHSKEYNRINKLLKKA
jgi:ABC-type xylose transport system substrate-binding protein